MCRPLPLEASGPRRIDLTLNRALPVSGHVTDDAGRAIPDAEVTLAASCWDQADLYRDKAIRDSYRLRAWQAATISRVGTTQRCSRGEFCFWPPSGARLPWPSSRGGFRQWWQFDRTRQTYCVKSKTAYRRLKHA